MLRRRRHHRRSVSCKAFVAQAFSIPSASMEPQLELGDRVVVSRLAYRLHDPRRGDIVVFDAPDAAGRSTSRSSRSGSLEDVLEGVGLRRPDETELIKRVVGLPGETVEARGGRVVIDGRELRRAVPAAGRGDRATSGR